MFFIHGIDRLKKIQPVGIFGADEFSAGAMAVRQIIDDSHLVATRTQQVGMGVGTQVIVGYIVPANKIFELKSLGVIWNGGGTVTAMWGEFTDAGNIILLSGVGTAAPLNIVQWSGSIFLRPTDTVDGRYTITVAGVTATVYVAGTLWPQP